MDRTSPIHECEKCLNTSAKSDFKPYSVRSEGSTSCSSVQQEIIFANFQACIQAFMPGYRLFFTLLWSESLKGTRKPNIKTNAEPFPNFCFSHEKGVLGSISRDAFTLRILSYSVPKILRFLAFFHKTNEKPYSHDIHALTRKSRQSIIFTLDLN